MPVVYDYEIVNTFPHDTGAFTQGLFVEDGHFVESTGMRGESTLRRVEIETGEIIENHPLPDRYFGEGVVAWENRLIMLTYKAGIAFVFDRTSLKKVDQFRYPGEGWGLTHNGTHLVMSDGTSRLRLLDPETYDQVGAINVTYQGQPLKYLNELEFINGEIFANIYGKDLVVTIDPSTGHITGVIQLSGLLKREDFIAGKTDVLNGIAYDEKNDRLFVTGKRWPKLFEIKLRPRPLRETK
ncbi:MAG: glutaminyl-peptide cyclotransferase [Parvularculaceae bacterium]|nr:MAG: glutaminyl-peptide cyclotransferase [Parvularculaceae bacterium]